MNLPLERKRRPGRPKITANALSRQPNETQKISDLGIRSCDGSDSDSSINDEAPPQKNPDMKQKSVADQWVPKKNLIKYFFN